ncbi:PIN domain-containing protein [Microcoleus sp. FACHB-672]|uniref:PIN domain-containing protein n=1 Tax=Microcoleus sp. FACHB-672 TaxID=2692825 RepID=UPI0016887CE4|nr:PIN domain-containing protein [Microcoleus sp. FACHB-672]MBD2041392.1 hypothetical protein [Microcoleus sp. FACHB-672]
MKSGALPPVVVVLDIFALMAGRARDWETYSRAGTCYVPQVVYEQIELLCDSAPEPAQEQVAREFMRFWPKSGWHLTNAHTSHPSLQPAASAELSGQARLVVAVAQSAYGVSQEQPGKLVVFVSTSLSLLKRMQSLNAPNLCCITSTALLQWARTGQRPPAVTQQMQVLNQALATSSASGFSSSGNTHSSFGKNQRSSSSGNTHSSFGKNQRSSSSGNTHSSFGKNPGTSSNGNTHSTFGKNQRSSSQTSSTRSSGPVSSGSSGSSSRLRAPKPASTTKSRTADATAVKKDKSESVFIRQRPRSVAHVRSFKPNLFVSLISGVIALVALVVAAGIIWQLAQPASFNVFWQKQVMPVWQQKVVPAIPSQMRQQLGIK